MSSSPSMRVRAALVVLAGSVGALGAWAKRWTADDAFISFRYARNMVEGQGLVFNVGERVEGYTNFLWTVLSSAAPAAGIDVELWAQVLGIAAYVGLIGLLGVRSAGWPLAALVLAVHPDVWTFATSGLETSLFMGLAAVGLLLSVSEGEGRRWRAGIALGLCILTRPDGAIFALCAVLGAGLCAPAARRVRALLAVALPIALLAGAHLAFRLLYYGQWVPNTYFAKSAGQSWYAQGLVYLGFFVQRSWPVLLGALGGLLWLRGAPRLRATQAAVFLLAGLGYGLFVVRVGGDFMYARLLVPVLPPLLMALERCSCGRPRAQVALLLLVGAACVVSPMPDGEAMWKHGIVDERSFPDPQRAQPGRAETLRRFVGDLPVVVAFTGGDARLMYRARVPVAIESETGLTDRYVAHQPLSRRGRVGHDKPASLDYLVRERGAHLVLRRRALSILDVADRLPVVPIELGAVHGWLLRWDPALIAELERRGARVPDFGRFIDAEISRLPGMTDLEARRAYEKLELFYFAHVHDAARRAPFMRRLREPAAAARSR